MTEEARETQAQQPNHWQKDNDVVGCTKCGVLFGFLTRKHHCRHCGLIFCDLCTNHQGVHRTEYVRFCGDCLENSQDLEPLEVVAGQIWAIPWAASSWGMRFFSRMIIIKLEDETLLLYAPCPLRAQVKSQLAALGQVGHVVCPGPHEYFHEFAAAYQAAYPSATLWVTSAVKEKNPNLRFDRELTPESLGSWGAGLKGFLVSASPSYSELLLLHDSSKTLVCANFVALWEEETLGNNAAMKGVIRIAGMLGHVSPSVEWDTELDKEYAMDSVSR